MSVCIYSEVSLFKREGKGGGGGGGIQEHSRFGVSTVYIM